MKDVDLFAKMLDLPKPWKVTDLEPDFTEKTITVRLEWVGASLPCCPICANECGVYDHREERIWRHLDTMQFKTFLTARVPRINCPEHGVKTILTPWTLDKGRFTVLFERFAIDVILACKTLEQAAQLLGLTWDQVHVLQKRAVERGLARRADHEMSAVGVDEKQFLRGQDYASVLYNLEKGTVINLVRGRDEKAARELMFTLSDGCRCCVQVVAMDMWKAYENVAKEAFPDADIVFDRFHICIDQRRLNERDGKTYACV